MSVPWDWPAPWNVVSAIVVGLLLAIMWNGLVWAFLDFGGKRRRKALEQQWVEAFRAGQRRGAYVVSHGMRVYTSPYGTEQRMVSDAQATALEGLDEAVLLGPVSAWVAEGEARAVRDWNEKPVRTIYELDGSRSWTPNSRFVLCDQCEWEDVTLPDSPERHVIRRKRCTEHRPQPTRPNPAREVEIR